MLTVNQWGYVQLEHIEDEEVFEAWERMTYYGVQRSYGHIPEWCRRFEPRGLSVPLTATEWEVYFYAAR